MNCLIILQELGLYLILELSYDNPTTKLYIFFIPTIIILKNLLIGTKNIKLTQNSLRDPSDWDKKHSDDSN